MRGGEEVRRRGEEEERRFSPWPRTFWKSKG